MIWNWTGILHKSDLCYHYHHNRKHCPSSFVLCAFVVVCKCGKRDSRDVHSCHTLTRLIASLVVIIVIIITIIAIIVHHYRCFDCYHGCHLYIKLISHLEDLLHFIFKAMYVIGNGIS